MSLQFEIFWNWSEESDEFHQILPLLTKLRSCTNIVSLILNLWSYYPKTVPWTEYPPEEKLRRVLLLTQQYLPQIENVSLIDKINHKNDLGYFDVSPSIKDLTCILGFKKLKKMTLNINKFYGILEWLQENAIPTSVKEIEVINGHAILEEVFIRAFERSTAFPCLEKLVIDPFDYYGRKCVPDKPKEETTWRNFWIIDNLVENLEILGAIPNLQIWNMSANLSISIPGKHKKRLTIETRIEILNDGIKIINDKFPIETEFELIDRISGHRIVKRKWKKAEVQEVIEASESQSDSSDESDEESSEN